MTLLGLYSLVKFSTTSKLFVKHVQFRQFSFIKTGGVDLNFIIFLK
jgi:hypothetical protein